MHRTTAVLNCCYPSAGWMTSPRAPHLIIISIHSALGTHAGGEELLENDCQTSVLQGKAFFR